MPTCPAAPRRVRNRHRPEPVVCILDLFSDIHGQHEAAWCQNVREDHRLTLPLCRAPLQVSEEDKNAAPIYPTAGYAGGVVAASKNKGQVRCEVMRCGVVFSEMKDAGPVGMWQANIPYPTATLAQL